MTTSKIVRVAVLATAGAILIGYALDVIWQQTVLLALGIACIAMAVNGDRNA